MTSMDTTWDGLPVAPDDPRGAGVVVRRISPSGPPEYLLLHRHHEGPEYEGDWAWTSPSGARFPDEPVLTCATRELLEEAGLSGADLRPVDLSGRWAAFATVAPASFKVVLDHEHDRYEWLTADAALPRLAPASVARLFRRGSTLALPAITFHAGTLFVDGTAAGTVSCTPTDHDTVTITCDCPDWVRPQAIWVYLRDAVFPAHPTATHATAEGPLEEIGFRSGVLDRHRIIGL